MISSNYVIDNRRANYSDRRDGVHTNRIRKNILDTR